MSDKMGRQVNRRQFLSLGLSLAGGVVAMGPRSAEAENAKDRPDCTRWAFLSDIHIAADPDNRFRGFYPHRNLEAAVSEIVSDLPDGVVVTGDISRSKGGLKAYAHVQAKLAPLAEKRPVYLGLGNHDHRRDFFKAFDNGDTEGEAVKDKHVVTAMAGPVRMIVLDSLLYTNIFGGMIGREQRDWLRTYLHVCDDTPTIVFLHHPPRADLLDTGRLFDILRPCKKVKAVVYGHSHKYEFLETDGMALINLPATGYNFTSAQPVGWVEARLSAKGGEFVLHAVGGNPKRDGRTTMIRWRA